MLYRLHIDLLFLIFQNQTLKSVTLCFGQNCSGVLVPCWTAHSLTSTANVTSALVTMNENWNSSSQQFAESNSKPDKEPNFTFNLNIQRDVSSACPKRVLNRYEGPCLFSEWSETQVEAAALWSVALAFIFIFITLTCFHCWATLTSCIYHSEAYCRPSVCFCLKTLFVFTKIRQYFSRECSLWQCVLHASSESLTDIATVTKGGVA